MKPEDAQKTPPGTPPAPPTPPGTPTAPPPPPGPPAGSITLVAIEDEMKGSYIDYAMSVIIARALPDVRDGMKPVHRRILYGMSRQGLASNKPHKKCAKVVGDVIANFHPHGDAAVYDALVRLAQDFSMRYELIDGQGNFGSVDGDPPAAYRYTECRLTKLAEEILEDFDKDTVDFLPNFDESTEEPTVLPAKVPALLLNGTDGIAVGMATKIPPHNMGEIVDMLIHLVDHPEATVDDLLKMVKGPDFPTGGLIIAGQEMREAYRTGRGKIMVRARTEFEKVTGGRGRIVVTEIPYQVNKSKLLEDIAAHVRERSIEGIADLRDESDRQGMRIVIEVKKGENEDLILNQLLKHTDMQVTFGFNMVALVDNKPVQVDLRRMGVEFLEHRKVVVIRRTKFELRKAEERAHILEGLKIALDNIDEVVALIKKSADADTARNGLVARFKLTPIQAQAILDMRLQRLTSLETKKIIDELAELRKEIARLKAILQDIQRVWALIKDELKDIKTRFGDKRRTEFITDSGEFDARDLLADEQKVITVTHSGYIKMLPLDTYRRQHRGGKGLRGIDLREEDFVEAIFIANTFDVMLFFTNRGRVYGIEVYKLPEAGREARGRAVANLLNVEAGEKVTAMIPIHCPDTGAAHEPEKAFETEETIILVTRRGMVKRSPLFEFRSCLRARGLIAHRFTEDDDELVTVAISDGTRSIVIGTKLGKAIRFDESQTRVMGRDTQGVRGIDMVQRDRVCGMEVLKDVGTLLVVTEKGIGKRTDLSEYRIQNRAGQGVKNIEVTARSGNVAGFREVAETDEVVLSTAQGKVIRLQASTIRLSGRDTQGVKLIDIDEGDRVVEVTVVKLGEPEAGSGGPGGNAGGNGGAGEKEPAPPPPSKVS